MAKAKAKPSPKKTKTRRAAKQQTQAPYEPAPIRARGIDLERTLKDKVARASALASVFNAGLEYAKPEHWTPALSMLADLTNDAYDAAQAYIEHQWRVEQAAIQFMAGVPVQVQK